MAATIYRNTTNRSMTTYGIFRELCYALERVGLSQVPEARIFDMPHTRHLERANPAVGLERYAHFALFQLPWDFVSPAGNPCHSGLALAVEGGSVSGATSDSRGDHPRLFPIVWEDGADFSDISTDQFHWPRNIIKTSYWNTDGGYDLLQDYTYDPAYIGYNDGRAGTVSNDYLAYIRPHKGYEFYYSVYRQNYLSVGHTLVALSDNTLSLFMGSNASSKNTASDRLALIISNPARVPGFERAEDYLNQLGPLITCLRPKTSGTATQGAYLVTSDLRGWTIFNKGRLSSTPDRKRFPQLYHIQSLDSAFRYGGNSDTQIVWGSPETIAGRGYQRISPCVAFPFRLWDDDAAQFGPHPKNSTGAYPHISDAIYLRDVAYSDPLAPGGIHVDPNSGDTWLLIQGWDSMCGVRLAASGESPTIYDEDGTNITFALPTAIETIDIDVDGDGDISCTLVNAGTTSKAWNVSGWPNGSLTWDTGGSVWRANNDVDTTVDNITFTVPYTLEDGDFVRVTAEIEMLSSSFPSPPVYQPNARSRFLLVGRSNSGALECAHGRGVVAYNSNEPNDPYSGGAMAGWQSLDQIIPVRRDLYPDRIYLRFMARDWVSGLSFRMRNLQLTVYRL
jgi:hypothetical protein